jgi:hypothetical protein
VARGRGKNCALASRQCACANFVENSSIHTFLDHCVVVC